MAMDERFPLALSQGTILAGQYTIEKAIGQGGFGITYKATDYKTNQKVAIKEFFPDTLAYREATTVISYPGERSESYEYGKECFLQEAKTLAEFIGNENIVRIHSYFEENGTAYFVMDYIEGKSFDDYLKERGGKISVEEAQKILVPIMDALNVVHSKGIVHRDVTPDNIYITNDGTVKLLDFGAARYSLGDKSRSLDVILKHGFAPKEQYTRRGKQGSFTDVYSLAATFYFAITGRRPPDSVDRLEEDDLIPPSNLGVIITDYQENAILQALSVQPAERFESMAVFKKVLLNENTASQQAEFTSPAAPVVQQAPPVQAAQPMQAASPVISQKAGNKNKLILIAGGVFCLAVISIVLVLTLSGAVGNKPDSNPSADNMVTWGTGGKKKTDNAASSFARETYYNRDGSVSYCYEHEYDAAGKEIGYMYIRYDGDDIVSSWYEYEYDADGNQIRRTRYDSDGSVSGWQENQYDADGNQIRRTRYDSDGSVLDWYEYEYDAAGNRIKETYYCDSDGRLFWSTEIEYDAAGNIIKSMTRSDYIGSYDVEYDAAGNRIKITDYLGGWSEYEQEYDAAGNRIKETSYYSDGTVSGWYEYEYDAAGNLIKETSYAKEAWYDRDASVDHWIEWEYGPR